MLKLVLASQSPRRRQILEEAGYFFSVDSVKVSELIDKNLNSHQAVEKIACDKARAWMQAHKHLKSQGKLVLSADTMVFCQGQPLGKPENKMQALEFLRLLSGKTHSVISGICLIDLDSGREVTRSEETLVHFKVLTEAEIQDYVATGEPMDKAGGYAIQGEAKKFVTSIEGSLSNVIGLPLELFEKLLKENHWNVSRKSP